MNHDPGHDYLQSSRILSGQLASALERQATAENEARTLKAKLDRTAREIFLNEEGSIAIREAKAKTHDRYITLEAEYLEAESKANLEKARKQAFEVKWETWRTNESTRRAEMRIL